MAPVERERSFRVRISDEELAMVHALADAEGLSASDIVRQLIRRHYIEKFGDKPPKRKR